MSLAEMYRFPTTEEKELTIELINKRVLIFWDGLDEKYPGKIVDYKVADGQKGMHFVIYDDNGGGDGSPSEEDLQAVIWQIWNGTEEEYETMKVFI